MTQFYAPIFLVSLVCISTLSSAQISDSIKVEKRSTTVFSYQGELLNAKKMGEIMQKIPEAAQEFKLAKRYYHTSIFLGAAGAALLVYPLGRAASSDESLDVKLFSAGLGVILVSIPFSINYTIRAKKAVSIYNEGLSISSRHLQPYTFLSSHGVGIGIKF
jgi:hypothetical protein